MKFFIDLFPVVVFFVVYQMRDMYDATAAVMLACAVQTFGYWLFAREFDRNHVLALALVWPIILTILLRFSFSWPIISTVLLRFSVSWPTISTI